LESLLCAPERLCARDRQRLGIGIPPTTRTAARTLRLIWASNIELGEIDNPSISTHILGNSIRVCFNLVSL
jgi:hypothetical protein